MHGLLQQAFAVDEVRLKQFVSWSTLNWIGKLVTAAGLMLSAVGIKNGTTNIVLNRTGNPGGRFS